MLILKQLRRKKNISQSDLAAIIGVSLRTVQLYEKENANIPIKNLNKIAAYFEMGIDQLYAKEVNESDIIYDVGGSDSKKPHTIRKLGPGKYLISSPLLVGDEQATYVTNFDDVNYVKKLPKISFLVEQVSVVNYLAFEILNDSMNNSTMHGIPQNSIVLGKRVSQKELIKQVNTETGQWILVCNSTIMCKNITQYKKKNKSITCHSLNSSPEYPDFDMAISEVLEFYKVIKKQIN